MSKPDYGAHYACFFHQRVCLFPRMGGCFTKYLAVEHRLAVAASLIARFDDGVLLPLRINRERRNRLRAFRRHAAYFLIAALLLSGILPRDGYRRSPISLFSIAPFSASRATMMLRHAQACQFQADYDELSIEDTLFAEAARSEYDAT